MDRGTEQVHVFAAIAVCLALGAPVRGEDAGPAFGVFSPDIGGLVLVVRPINSVSATTALFLWERYDDGLGEGLYCHYASSAREDSRVLWEARWILSKNAWRASLDTIAGHSAWDETQPTSNETRRQERPHVTLVAMRGDLTRSLQTQWTAYMDINEKVAPVDALIRRIVATAPTAPGPEDFALPEGCVAVRIRNYASDGSVLFERQWISPRFPAEPEQPPSADKPLMDWLAHITYRRPVGPVRAHTREYPQRPEADTGTDVPQPLNPDLGKTEQTQPH